MLNRFAAAALLSFMPAQTAFADQLSPEEFCRAVSEFAEGAMGARQFGTSLTEALDRLARNPLAREIVLSAYEVDMRFLTESKEREMAVFRDDWTLRCYRGELATLAP